MKGSSINIDKAQEKLNDEVKKGVAPFKVEESSKKILERFKVW
jgi:hypothetical protein